jgi:hypothetical protein
LVGWFGLVDWLIGWLVGWLVGFIGGVSGQYGMTKPYVYPSLFTVFLHNVCI